MSAASRLLLLAAASALVVSVAVTAPAEAAVLKNKTTGEVLRGTILNQKVNGLNIFKLEAGGSKFIRPEEWDVVEPDSPAPASAPAPAPATPPAVTPPTSPAPSTAPRPATPAPPAPSPARTPAPAPANAPAAGSGPGANAAPSPGGGPVVYVLPLTGPIESHALVEALESGLNEAKKVKAALVIVRMNTPGGSVYLADTIIRLLEKVDWAPVVSYVSGEDKEALSAGAYICLATQKIFMAPGCTLGAATPYRSSVKTGAAEIDEKFTSAFRAKFRSLAQSRGHPVALADAMVDGTTSVVQIFLGDKPSLVTADEAARLKEEHKSDKTFKRGKTLNLPGKVITLTSDEAREFGVCAGIAANEKEVAQMMGLADAQVVEGRWVPFLAERLNKERQKKFDDVMNTFRLHIEQANAFDPQNNYIAPGTAQWKVYTDRAMAHLKECARALTQIEAMSKDERYDLYVSEELLTKLKGQLDANYRRLGAQRNF
jgi:hypothetical protein